MIIRAACGRHIQTPITGLHPPCKPITHSSRILKTSATGPRERPTCAAYHLPLHRRRAAVSWSLEPASPQPGDRSFGPRAARGGGGGKKARVCLLQLASPPFSAPLVCVCVCVCDAAGASVLGMEARGCCSVSRILSAHEAGKLLLSELQRKHSLRGCSGTMAGMLLRDGFARAFPPMLCQRYAAVTKSCTGSLTLPVLYQDAAHVLFAPGAALHANRRSRLRATRLLVTRLIAEFLA